MLLLARSIVMKWSIAFMHRNINNDGDNLRSAKLMIKQPKLCKSSCCIEKLPTVLATFTRRYQKVSILDFTGAKDDGGDDNCSYMTCKTPVKSPPPTIDTQLFTGQMPFLSTINDDQPTVSEH